MKKNKIISLFGFALAVVICATGCGHAIVLSNSDVDNNSDLYYNGNEISGIPLPKDTLKPAEEIPLETKQHETASETTEVYTTAQTEGDTPTEAPQTPAVPQTPDVPQTQASEEKPIETIPETTAVQTTKAPQNSSDQTAAPPPSSNILPDDDLPVNSYKALNYSEMKAVWISYFELYPILTGKTKAQFEKGIGEYFDNAKSLGINTVYVHVRPYGDAIYKSDYFPWSKYCTGYIGENPGFDPLKVMIEQAHKRNISFHAWINPLRCYQQDDAPQVDDSYLTKQWYNYNDGDYIVKVNSYWYLNPAYEQVTDLIALGVSEIVSGYDVDGVHIDDYFYPTTESWFDRTAFNKSGYTSLSQFRLDNCTRMVSTMYNAVKSHNKTVLFGISTQGNVTNNQEVLYADVKKWCSEPGYADYMAPQIYYGFENSGQPFSEVVDEWDKMLSGTGKTLVPGLAVYKIGTEDTWAGSGKYEWINNTEIIKRQIEKSRTAKCYGGIALYSYQFIFEPSSDVSAAVQKEIAAFKPLLN